MTHLRLVTCEFSHLPWATFLDENNYNYDFYRFCYLFLFFLREKTRIKFLASWWCSREKYFCFMTVVSRDILQRYTEFNRLLQRVFFHIILACIIPSLREYKFFMSNAFLISVSVLVNFYLNRALNVG